MIRHLKFGRGLQCRVSDKVDRCRPGFATLLNFKGELFEMYDVAIIGAGVIGTAIARELTQYKAKVVILERGYDVSVGTTKANSGIVHAGYDAPFESNKGRFNAKGNALYEEVCKELDVPFHRIGSLVCAFEEDDLVTLENLKANGEKLGIPGLKIIDQATVRSMEPHISDTVISALYAPTAGITEPWALAVAYAENAMDNGAKLFLDFEVKSIESSERGYKISSADLNIEAKYVVNCAGVYADEIYKLIDPSADLEIQPIRGQYYLLDKNCGSWVNHVVFPCPSKLGKGTLVVPTVDGNLLVGPDSEPLGADHKEAVETERERLDYVRTLASKLIKDVPYRETVTTFSGLRADPNNGDFILEESRTEGFFNAAGIKSPGLSCAPAIGKYMAELVAAKGRFEPNPHFNPIRRPGVKMAHMTDAEKNELIQKDPRYGRIICRCEMITEGEIVDVIHRNAGGRTVNGIKRRARPGAGRCQGGFCSPRVLEILARELKQDIREICLESKESKVLMGMTKSADQEVM